MTHVLMPGVFHYVRSKQSNWLSLLTLRNLKPSRIFLWRLFKDVDVANVAKRFWSLYVHQNSYVNGEKEEQRNNKNKQFSKC